MSNAADKSNRPEGGGALVDSVQKVRQDLCGSGFSYKVASKF